MDQYSKTNIQAEREAHTLDLARDGVLKLTVRYRASMDPAAQEVHADPEAGDGRRERLRSVAGLLAVLIGLAVVAWLLSLASDDTASDSDSTPSPEQVAPAESSTTIPPPDTGGGEAVDDTAVEAARGPFNSVEGRLVYLSGGEVAVVDLANGDVTRVPIRAWGSIIPLADYELLTDQNRTVALSLSTEPPAALLIASTALIVPSTEPLIDHWVVSRPDGPNGRIRLGAWHDYGVLSLQLEAPAGSELRFDSKTGLLVTPPVGRTFRATVGGFELMSEHRLLAAGGGVWVEQRCDEQLSCEVTAVDSETGAATELPDDFAAELSEISVSPDGRWLLNDTSPAWLFDLHTEQLRLLEVGGFGQARWLQDSASVAWLTSDRTPTLVVSTVQPVDDEPGWFVVELAGLEADPSPSSVFLLDWELRAQ